MKPRLNEQTIRTWARLVRTETALVDQVQTALKAAGLPPLGWYDVLLELQRAPGGELRQYEIGAQTLLTKYNLSRLVDRLQREALVERHACAEDGRGNLVRITQAGHELLQRIWPVYAAVLETQFENRLTTDEILSLERILNKLA
ncbi:MarR family winged helix-turn-helix transcriptional regulator [Marinobacterium rhizophilum]|uniref:Winged helix-turn-helix transcriptional regulator n=1 Tax=Marinobacterium rhizophilum TaxID=420402 RepID=A0ABY5HH44_9GAMM|nr:MarR family winged helix-turn-helix transcriptional regulator [Marinobacterium rhizophilum]UTW11682.1 winged helix-turn-helix transcriptional regulator [Marinobacterium rhizophilum]